MSYSLNPSKGAYFAVARAVCEAQYDAMASSQKCHQKDKDAAFAAVDAVAGKVTFNPEMDVVISLSGSVSWDWQKFQQDDPAIEFTGANVSVGIHQMLRAPAV